MKRKFEGTVEFKSIKNIGKTGPGIISRAEVKGGWLVYTSGADGNGLAFVPDPNHEWKLDPL